MDNVVAVILSEWVNPLWFSGSPYSKPMVVYTFLYVFPHGFLICCFARNALYFIPMLPTVFN